MMTLHQSLFQNKVSFPFVQMNFRTVVSRQRRKLKLSDRIGSQWVCITVTSNSFAQTRVIPRLRKISMTNGLVCGYANDIQ